MWKLDIYYDHAQTVSAKTKLKQLRTESGIHDTVQEFFFDKLFSAYENKRGTKAREEALAAAMDQLPSYITSPVWQLQGVSHEQHYLKILTWHLTGLDPHIHTPVEILHVALLGFVKYFGKTLLQIKSMTTRKKTSRCPVGQSQCRWTWNLKAGWQYIGTLCQLIDWTQLARDSPDRPLYYIWHGAIWCLRCVDSLVKPNSSNLAASYWRRHWISVMFLCFMIIIWN